MFSKPPAVVDGARLISSTRTVVLLLHRRSKPGSSPLWDRAAGMVQMLRFQWAL